MTPNSEANVIGRIAALAGFAAVMAAPTAALAQDQLGGVFALPPEERFAATDTNKDGKVSREEYQAILNPQAKPYVDAVMLALDTDEDGFLTEAEMNTMRSGRGFGRGGGGAAAAAQRAQGGE